MTASVEARAAHDHRGSKASGRLVRRRAVYKEGVIL